MATSFRFFPGVFLSLAGFWLLGGLPASAQAGPGPLGNLDLVQIYVDGQGHRNKEAERQRIESNRSLVDSGAASILDLTAPSNALGQFDRALALMKQQKSSEAVKYLRKAIAIYPKFVSAHINLGVAYLDLNDPEHARAEFETAANLDDKFARSFLNLGVLLMNRKDFAGAESQLEKAATLRPKDVKILAALARAQNGNHQYQRALETVQQVHALDHKDFADVHYVGAGAALALKDFDTMQRELTVFVSEDPVNPLAPSARNNLEILAQNKNAQAEGSIVLPDPASPGATPQPRTFPNSERLNLQLRELGAEGEGGICDECSAVDDAAESTDAGIDGAPAAPAVSRSNLAHSPWTIRATVDEVAQFFSVSQRGRMVNGLELSDIRIRDNDKPPAKILQFVPQSKLPLRLALLVDTSSSVKGRFKFEKEAADRLIRKVMKNGSDLGFVVGFSTEIKVTQDFTADPEQLSAGLEKLVSGGGTRLFDAVSFACRKLGEDPEKERVARVLVVLTDGEDNSSLRRLRQTIEDAERSGVTIYSVSTRHGNGAKTDADHVLEALAERTGGEAMFPGDAAFLAKAFGELGDLISSRYLVAYNPASFVPDGGYRTIRITAEKSGKRLHVQARKGYYARLAAPAN